MTPDQTFALAVQHHQAGRMGDAEQLCRQILAHQPNHADAFHLLGVIAHHVGRLDIAADLIGRAIRLRVNFPDAHNNLGNVLREAGRLDEAIAAYRQAISLNPLYADAHGNLGVALKEKGQLDEAMAAYRRAISLRPNYPEAHGNLGNIFWEKGQLDEAIAAYRQAIALDFGLPDAHSNLGNALRDKDQLEEAVAACRQAIALRPNYPEAYSNLGAALKKKGLLDEAIAAYRTAISQRPDYPDALSNLGSALREKGDLDESEAACRRAIVIKPKHPQAFNNLGNALRDKGRWGDSIAAYRQAIALRPGYPEGRTNLALTLLLIGDFANGLPEYQWRRRCKSFPRSWISDSQPQWDGADLGGRTLLLHAEQGFGDTIQFSRYLPRVAERCRRIIVACQPQLMPLLTPILGVARWIASTEVPPPFDAHCPLPSLPLLFHETLETIPGDVPYLQADAVAVERWRQCLESPHHPRQVGTSQPVTPSPHHSLKIGLAWAGSPEHTNDRNRSIPLSILAPLADVCGVGYFSLQVGEAGRQVNDAPAGMNLVDWTQDLHDFADTAALIANLDLVISVDTAVVHLAGAMGKPVWTLLPFAPDWRWLLDRNDSPWYPTMRLFRQPRIGDWASVIARVTEALGMRREQWKGEQLSIRSSSASRAFTEH